MAPGRSGRARRGVRGAHRRRRPGRHVGEHRVHGQRPPVSRREAAARAAHDARRPGGDCAASSPWRARATPVSSRSGRPMPAARRCAPRSASRSSTKRSLPSSPIDTPDPLRFFYRREYSRVGTQFSRDYSFVGYSGSQQLQLARRRRPFSLADFKAERESQAERAEGIPRRDSLGGRSRHGCRRHGQRQGRLPGRAHDLAVDRTCRHGGHASRRRHFADHDHQGSDPPAHHAALSHRRRYRPPTDVVHNYLSEPKAIQVSVARRPVSRLRPAHAARRRHGGSARREARSGMAFEASTVGRSTVTATATTPGDGDAVELPVPVLPYGAAMEIGQAGSIVGPGRSTPSSSRSRTSRTPRRARSRWRSLRRSPARSSAPSTSSTALSVRLHGADHLELLPESGRGPRARRPEDRASRAGRARRTA